MTAAPLPLQCWRESTTSSTSRCGSRSNWCYFVRLRQHGLWLAIANGELNEDHADHVSESRGEDYYNAETTAEACAEALRAARGWSALQDHPEVAKNKPALRVTGLSFAGGPAPGAPGTRRRAGRRCS